MTYADALAAIVGSEGVKGAVATSPVDVFDGLKKGVIQWIVGVDEEAWSHSHTVILHNYVDENNGDGYWLGGKPAILQTPPAAPTYFGEWSISAAQITSVVNAKWAATQEGGDDDAVNLQIVALRDDQVLVRGDFHIATSDKFQPKGFLITLINPAQAPSAQNAKFQEVVLAG